MKMATLRIAALNPVPKVYITRPATSRTGVGDSPMTRSPNTVKIILPRDINRSALCGDMDNLFEHDRADDWNDY